MLTTNLFMELVGEKVLVGGNTIANCPLANLCETRPLYQGLLVPWQ